MKQSDAKKIVQLLTQLTESINGPATREPGTGTGVPLSDRIDKLDNRVSEVQFDLATLASNAKAGFDRVDKRLDRVDKRLDTVDRRLDTVDKRLDTVDKRLDTVDKRFDVVDRSIESARVELVDLVTRVHDELTGRIIDLEVPGSGGKGSGGRGTGGGGVPLAS